MRSDLAAKKGTDRYGSLLFLYLFRLISATSRSFGACLGLKAPWVPGFALLLSLCLAAAQSWAPSACSHGSTQEQNSWFASRPSDQSQCSQQHQQLHSSPAVDSWNPGNPGAGAAGGVMSWLPPNINKHQQSRQTRWGGWQTTFLWPAAFFSGSKCWGILIDGRIYHLNRVPKKFWIALNPVRSSELVLFYLHEL